MGIKIDAQDYEVKMTPEAIGGEDGKRSFIGTSEEETNLIVVDGTLAESRQEEVLLHELIHIADMGMPEFMVTNISTRLYGYLKTNDLLRPGLMARVSDGELGTVEMEKLNKASNEMAEQAEEMGLKMPSNRLVSEAPWHGESGGVLEKDGRVNRIAVHMAARDLLRGTFSLEGTTRRKEAKRLIDIFRNVLKEDAPSALSHLAQ